MGFFTRGRDADTGTIVAPIEEQLDEGDHERFSHYVEKKKIVKSAVSGKTVTALCGKKWIPSRDPERFPICPTCKEIHARMLNKPDSPKP